MRAPTVAANYDYPIIRIDTNQGVYGLGEVRDAGGKANALMYMGLLLGRKPVRYQQILRTIRQFAAQSRQVGGYSAIDIALHDIAGKVQGMPSWRLEAETKKRDRIRIYADTTSAKEPKVYAERMKKRREMGITFIKMDLHSSLVSGRPGATGPGRALNEEVVREHLREPGYFEPTKQYDDIKPQGFHSGGAWPHYDDDDGNWCNCVSYE